MSLTIYHNPRCSKSRQTLSLLQENGHEPVIIEYLKTPPDAATIGQLVNALNATPAEIMRTNEAEYKEATIDVGALDDAAQIKWLADNPRVLQRPIVVNGDRARIGRPPESVLEILS
ncbi:MAG: arsenate reductase (glutaredoxin) [Gammaproteobacteria bacterium]|nr:arsenate reductase (glutaredoxin) [Gammaproteobacteria bacterium]